VCWDLSPEEIQGFLQAEKVTPYRDGPWGKTFRCGGPLEWFNASGARVERIPMEIMHCGITFRRDPVPVVGYGYGRGTG
jgi:hypothetical protein